MDGFYKDMFAILGVPSLLSMLSFFGTVNEFCDWLASYDKFLPLMFIGKHVMFAFLIEVCFAITISLFFRLCVKFKALKVCCFPVDKEVLEKVDRTILGVNILLMSYSSCILLVIIICYICDVNYIFSANYLKSAMIVLLLVVAVILGKWGLMDFSRNDCVAGEYKILKGNNIEKQFWVVFVGTQNNREEYFNKYVSLLRRDSNEAYNNNREFVEKVRIQALAGDGNKLNNSLNEIDGYQKLGQNEKEALVNFVCRIRVDPTFRK